MGEEHSVQVSLVLLDTAPLTTALAQATTALRAWCWACYQAAGSPYGETDAGLDRWLAEQRSPATVALDEAM